MRPRLAYGVCVQRRTTQLLQCRQSDQLREWCVRCLVSSCGRPTWRCPSPGCGCCWPGPGPDMVWQHHAEPLLAGPRGGRGQRRARRSDERRRAPAAPTPGCSWSRWCSWPAPASSCCTRWPRPEVLIATRTPASTWRQPVGLAIASVFALAVVVADWPPGITRWQLALRPRPGGCVLVAWAVVSLLDLPPLNRPTQARDVEGPLVVVALRRGRAVPGRRGALLPAAPPRPGRRAESAWSPRSCCWPRRWSR